MDLTTITMTALAHPIHTMLVAVVLRSAIGLLLSGRSVWSTRGAPIAAMQRQAA